MRIWGRKNSTNVRKVLWCAEELQVSYEHINAGGSFGVVDTPQFRAMNPNGLVPCLQDGDLVLWESNAIVRYLARQYGTRTFAPPDAKAWSTADKWMDWASLSFSMPLRDVFLNLVRRTPEERNEAEISKGVAQCGRLMGVADEALRTARFLSGDDLGIGDIPLGCLAYVWFSMPIERPEFPHLSGWYARLTERPAFQKAVMTPLT